MRYQHTQIGYLMLVIAFAVLAFYLWVNRVVFAQIPSAHPSLYTDLIMYGAVILILATFSSLSVTIDEEYLRVKFGVGVYRKSLLLSSIVSAHAVRNSVSSGWGIRWQYSSKSFWIYNVSGFDAVEVTLKNGSIYRIGTDEPAELERAIRELIQ